MGYRRFFKKALDEHFPLRSYELITEVEGQFARIAPDTRFASRSKNPIDKRLDFSAYFLSLIKVLERNC